jgi:CRISPR type I-E-associated protein CasB/Cse2
MTPKERATRYVRALERIRNDKGKMAALRRGLSPSTVMNAWPVVADLGGEIGQPVFVTLAALYATHPESSTDQSFGETCRRIGSQGSDKPLDSHVHRFRRLLSSENVDDLLGQLRAWVRLASSKGVGINYEGLMFDLLLWNKYADDIRVRWARAFWQPAVSEKTEGVEA